MIQALNRLDLVNFAFHTLSIPTNGSLEIPVPSVIGFLVKSVGLNIDILFFSPLFSSKLQPKSFPNMLNTFAKVFSLNFLASVNAQDSVNSHITLARL